MNGIRITQVKLTKKGRYALFCDEGFLFSVDEETLEKFHIAADAVLEEGQLLRVKENSDLQKAKNKAFDYLGYRDHSRNELVEKLMRSFDEDTANATAEKMETLGLIDDEKYAEKLAEDMIGAKRMSKRAVAQKLWQKGIDRDLTKVVLDTFDDDETQQIVELIERKYKSRLENENGRKTVFAALQRRGFSSHDIILALREIDCEIEEEY
ncbi:MAG: RecX family transcriptional regulator [Oscillospiraceae bacterium]